MDTTTGLSAVIFGNFQDLMIGQWGGLDIITDIYRRLAFDLSAPLAFVRLTGDSVTEVANEIDRV